MSTKMMMIMNMKQDNCVLADFCNHTWIPECGIQNATKKNKKVTNRLFIDECDMYEYNCDNNKSFILTNYTVCFGPACLLNPLYPTALRMGNYRLVDDKRRMVYDPTDRYGHPHTHPTTRLTFPAMIRPNLPPHMLNGRRRFTPNGPFRMTRTQKQYAKPTARYVFATTKRPTVILKREVFKKNGKRFVKIVKGFQRTSKYDSDFME